MTTCSMATDRPSEDELREEIARLSRDPVVRALLNSVSGLLAVMNPQRQVLAVNDALLQALDIRDAGQVFGLRLGQVIGCVHAHEPPAGCGTTGFCSTCGAAVAIATSLADNQPVERMCAVSVMRNGEAEDFCFRVRACPVHRDGRRYLLLFLQDVTADQRRAALERAFLHDITNTVTGLAGLAAAMVSRPGAHTDELTLAVHDAVMRLVEEVQFQRQLVRSGGGLEPSLRSITVAEVFQAVRDWFTSHPGARDKRLRIVEADGDVAFETDLFMVVRVLGNMVVNALEATDPGGEVRLWAERRGGHVALCVWNSRAIPAPVAKRIFQRNFTTKSEPGRGLGAYSMKLVGEKLLKGRVDFTSSDADGTVFRYIVPIRPVHGGTKTDGPGF
jgi:signal transduction histidine kinase